MKTISRTHATPQGAQPEVRRMADSSQYLNCPKKLRENLEVDGYLFLRNVTDTAVLASVRAQMLAQVFKRDGDLVPYASDKPLGRFEGFYTVLEELGQNLFKEVGRLDSLAKIFSELFEGQSKSLDFVWPRVAGVGRATSPHCDWVYLSRGSKQILSAWVPVMDIPIAKGPLMVLPRSHKNNPHTTRYLKKDADKLGFLNGLRIKHGQVVVGGNYSRSPIRVEKVANSHWLSEDFKVGDVVIFKPTTVHASLPNTVDLRLSIDLRYQPAEDEVDPRFSGPNLSLHEKRDRSLFDAINHLKRSLMRDGIGFSTERRRGAS